MTQGFDGRDNDKYSKDLTKTTTKITKKRLNFRKRVRQRKRSRKRKQRRKNVTCKKSKISPTFDSDNLDVVRIKDS